jgi:hypothetical protein
MHKCNTFGALTQDELWANLNLFLSLDFGWTKIESKLGEKEMMYSKAIFVIIMINYYRTITLFNLLACRKHFQ